jgi:DNA modification methylase
MSSVETIGRATLYLGDCVEIIPSLGSVDAVVTDPPYGLGFAYDGYDDTAEALCELIDGFLPTSRAIAKRVVVTPGVTNILRYPEADWIAAWTWGTTATYGKLGYNQWQPILFYGEDVPGFGSVNGVLKCDRLQVGGFASKDNKVVGGGHCCPKPLGFVQHLLKRFTLESETICDPFAGSGTTGVAAVLSGRSFIGIEQAPRYFDIACKRIEDAQRQGDFFVEAAA